MHRRFLPPVLLTLVIGACTSKMLRATSVPDLPSLEPSLVVTATASSTTIPTETVRPTLTQLIFPVTSPNGNLFADAVSQDTASEKGIPDGDTYRLNQFERPFSQGMTTYIPDLDISTYAILEENDWFFVLIEMAGSINAEETQIDYGIELDLDNDGFGDYLIWTYPPYSTSWTSDNVLVLADKNHDSAGLQVDQSDVPFSGDGYEITIFDGSLTLSEVPEPAWSRLDPNNSSIIQFAFQKSLVGNSFMWSVWADGGLKDPKMFSYNDQFTEEQAGSPNRDNEYYPIKSLNLIDSTCRVAYGFSPTGLEPLLCQTNEPYSTSIPIISTPTRSRSPKKPTPTSTSTKIPITATAIPPKTSTFTAIPYPLTPTSTAIPPKTPTFTEIPYPLTITAPASTSPGTPFSINVIGH